MKRKSDEMSPLGQKDTYRRSEMEFGVAADAYRSDPAKKATRNGAVMVTVAFSIAAFATVLAASVAICGELMLRLTNLQKQRSKVCSRLLLHVTFL